MTKISIIVPTYNESENIVELTEMLLALPLDARIIIVDDNSPDGTGQLADELRAKHKRVHVIHRRGKLGLGTAYVAGFKKALRNGSDLIVTMDADFSHHPKYIPAMVDLAADYHVTIGSRYVPGGGVENWEWYRKVLSWGANEFARAALGLKAHDCTAGFRCYRQDVLQSIDLDAIFSNGYSFLLEMAYKCQQLDCTFGETPIIFANRARGQSKISQTEIFKAMYTVLRLTASRLRFWRPKAPPVAPVKSTGQKGAQKF
ncbi:MAG TPA: polyprenol monophosphomannose synthase [Anaerolineae bacterium]|nr:polyprenol monophosphomannose synthase [Anaerolineae bacterium]